MVRKKKHSIEAVLFFVVFAFCILTKYVLLFTALLVAVGVIIFLLVLIFVVIDDDVAVTNIES